MTESCFEHSLNTITVVICIEALQFPCTQFATVRTSPFTISVLLFSRTRSYFVVIFFSAGQFIPRLLQYWNKSPQNKQNKNTAHSVRMWDIKIWNQIQPVPQIHSYPYMTAMGQAYLFSLQWDRPTCSTSLKTVFCWGFFFFIFGTNTKVKGSHEISVITFNLSNQRFPFCQPQSATVRFD